ncbi:MAG: response regulator [Bacteroidota bacterium]|jgi:response regulator RpfG family c-di-GMP phosphodiesterase
MERIAHFIVIDDDQINNMLCKYSIRQVNGELETTTFLEPEKGFEYIVNTYSTASAAMPSVLLLDINMPKWSGWDFLDKFEKLDAHIKNQIKVYMLSSSVDPKDIEKAKTNSNVVDYIVKPLNREIVLKIIESHS